jgi:hypothetical protein
MNKKIRGLFDGFGVNIGDKHLVVSNTEDITSHRIFIVDDVYEVGPNENVYECTMFKIKYNGKITKFQN